MTKQQKYMTALHSQGWKQLGGILPPEIYQKVLDYKNQLMNHYRQQQNQYENAPLQRKNTSVPK